MHTNQILHIIPRSMLVLAIIRSFFPLTPRAASEGRKSRGWRLQSVPAPATGQTEYEMKGNFCLLSFWMWWHVHHTGREGVWLENATFIQVPKSVSLSCEKDSFLHTISPQKKELTRTLTITPTYCCVSLRAYFSLVIKQTLVSK